MQPEVQCVHQGKNILGEGPIWNDQEKALYWTDVRAPSINRYDPVTGEVKTWPMPEAVGSFIFRKNGGIVAGMKSGFSFVDLEAGSVEVVAKADPASTNRLNDGKADRRGRYWCGSLNGSYQTADAGLYRLDADLTCHKMESDIIISNGIAFSPDDKTLYFADSRQEAVWAYDFDIDSGRISNRRVFVSTAGAPERVDGATVDAEGNYWCAHIHDSHIACYDPTGRLVRRVKLPIKHPTMCTFGGENLDVLYVTSGTMFLTPEEAPSASLAGSLFAIYGLGVKGIPEPRFAG